MQPDPRHQLLHAEIARLRDQRDYARAEVEQLKRVLRSEAEQFIGVASLTRKQAAVVGVIANRGRVSREALFDAVYCFTHEDDMPAGVRIVDQFILGARRKLAPHNVSIRWISCFGFEMLPEDIARLRRLAGLPDVASPSLVPSP